MVLFSRNAPISSVIEPSQVGLEWKECYNTSRGRGIPPSINSMMTKHQSHVFTYGLECTHCHAQPFGSRKYTLSPKY
jgi:hypothetical protein